MTQNEKIKRMRELAESIMDLNGSLEIRETGKRTRAVWNYAPELAELVLVAVEPKGVPAVIKRGVVHCGNCGSKEFQYDENIPSRRAQRSNKSRTLVFWSLATEFDGDDDPGVVCASCEQPADLPDNITIDWS